MKFWFQKNRRSGLQKSPPRLCCAFPILTHTPPHKCTPPLSFACPFPLFPFTYLTHTKNPRHKANKSRIQIYCYLPCLAKGYLIRLPFLFLFLPMMMFFSLVVALIHSFACHRLLASAGGLFLLCFWGLDCVGLSIVIGVCLNPLAFIAICFISYI